MQVLEPRPAERDSEVQLALTSKHWAFFEDLQVPAMIGELLFDPQGSPSDYRIVDMNGQFELFAGLQRSDALGRPASAVFVTNSPPLLEAFRSVHVVGGTRTVDQVVAETQRHYHIQVWGLTPRLCAAVCFDVTSYVREIDELARQATAWRAMLDVQPHPAWLKDDEGRYVAVNEAFVEATGLISPDAARGATEFDLWPAECAELLAQADLEARGSGTAKAIECWSETNAGPRRFESHIAPVFAADGLVCGTTGILLDAPGESDLCASARQTARNFEQIVDLAPDPIAIAKPSGEILYANRALCSLAQYTHEELLGRHVLDIGVWEQPQSRREAIEQLEGDGRFDCVEMVIVTPHGLRHQVELSGTIVELEQRRVLTVAMRDVTENRRVKGEARKAAERLTKYFSISPDLLCMVNSEGRFVWLNPAWERALGYPLSTLTGSVSYDYVHPEDLAPTISAMHRLRTGQAVLGVKNRYRRADGSWCWLEWRWVADEHGVIHAIARDITERREGEAALQAAERTTAASREQLHRVSELAHIGHFMVDFESNSLVWTTELYRIFGEDPSTFTPSFEFLEAAIHEDDLPKVREAVLAASSAGGAQQFQFRFSRSGGELRFCHATLEAGEAESGQHKCMFGLVQDLTDVWRAQEEQRRLQQQVMQAQKLESLGVLAGGIAHDFNNLLTSILGNTDLAIAELAPAQTAACAYLKDIEKVSRRAADLCRQMLAYSGKGRFVVQPFSLNEIVREMSHLLNVSISKKANLRCELFEELPLVVVDVTQIRQVVMNLITNASEAIVEPGGTVVLSTGVVDCTQADLQQAVGDGDLHPPGRYVFLEVADNGCGMDADTLNRIFDPFFTTKFTGRGLGLAAVLGIVRGHKGALKVRSRRGQGTRFTILLPAEDQPATSIEPAATARTEWMGHGRVLLVDDDENIRNMGKSLLERMGFEVLLAADGVEALEAFVGAKGGVRLVILDLTMPRMDGEACLRELRRLDPHVKVVMASGFNEQDVICRFSGRGPAGFVQKPYNSEDLLPKIQRALEVG